MHAVGVCSTVGYHDACGGSLEYCGVFGTVGDIMTTVKGYLEYHGDTQYLGGYLEYCGGEGCSVLWGYHPLYIEYCGGHHEYRGGAQYRGGTQITKDFLPTVLMISPMCIMIPHGTEYPHSTKDNPHGTHDIPHGTEHGTHDIPPRY